MGFVIFLVVVVVLILVIRSALKARRRGSTSGPAVSMRLPVSRSTPLGAGMTAADPGEQARRLAESQVASRQSMFNFDPQGPEKTATSARQSLNSGQLDLSFTRSVKAIDQLHDLYVFEKFRQREASPSDAFLIDTLRDSLAAVRSANSDANVREGVREATHRLRTISTSVEAARGDAALYRRGLDDLARLAPDVNVDDLFWN